jgi:amino acid transporter
MSGEVKTTGRRMTLLPLVGALYFMVSGGPYGLEELAQTVGFGVAMLVLVGTPIVWSVPTALMVGELAAALPEEGGYYAWVRRALGPFWGYQEAWLSLAASVFDMGIYPTLFVLYLGKLSPALVPSPFAVGLIVVAAGAAYNLAGARAVGQGSELMTVALLAPFAVLAAMAFFGHGPATPVVVTAAKAADAAGEGGADAAPGIVSGIVCAMWNYMGWDNASTVAGEVDRPQTTYPRAVLIAVALVAVTYLIPFAAMRAAGVDPSQWDTGAWVDVARAFGGAPLAVAVVVGGAVSAFGMFNALTLSYSRLPAVLAEDGYLPRVFARRLPHGAPWVSVVACCAAWTASLGLSFDRLLSLDIMLYGTSLVLEFVALVVLRVREPKLARPFRIPGGTAAVVVVSAGPVLLLGVALVKNLHERIAGVNALVFALGIMALGPVAYAVTKRVRALP